MSGLTSAAAPAGQTHASIPKTVVFIFTLYHKVKDHAGVRMFKQIYLGLFCRTICSSWLMYSAKVLRPGAVREQVVSGRLF